MNYINIEKNTKLDFKIINKPYLVKDYAKDLYACKNWSFEFLKNLDPNLKVNAVIGNMYSGKREFVSIKFEDYIKKIISDDKFVEI